MKRRTFLQTTSLAAAAAAAPTAQADHHGQHPVLLSLKMGMVGIKHASLVEKFAFLKEAGYDGVEINSPGGVDKELAHYASRTVGLPIHGLVNSAHWGVRLSDPDAEVRKKADANMLTAIRDSHAVGGSSMLLVPGAVRNPESENHDQVWKRSIEGIHKALPLAAKLGVHILIENVWNNFLYDPKGDDMQSADLLAKYIDEIDSPWVGSYFDIGNHQRFGKPAEWIRTLGKRIVKLDVKDWGKGKVGFCKIGDGDVDWPDVRKAVKEIGFTGWATAEVGGGEKERLKDILARMQKHLQGKA